MLLMRFNDLGGKKKTPSPCQHGGDMLVKTMVRHLIPIKGRAGATELNILLKEKTHIKNILESRHKLSKYAPQSSYEFPSSLNNLSQSFTSCSESWRSLVGLGAESRACLSLFAKSSDEIISAPRAFTHLFQPSADGVVGGPSQWNKMCCNGTQLSGPGVRRGGTVEVDLHLFAFQSAKFLQYGDKFHFIVHRIQTQTEFGNQVVSIN